MQVFNGKATVNQLAQNWGISYFGNMIGTLIIITLMSLGGVFPYQASGVLKMALPKVGLTFTQVSSSCYQGRCLTVSVLIASYTLLGQVSDCQCFHCKVCAIRVNV